MHRGRLAPGRYLCVLREKEDWILAKIKAGVGGYESGVRGVMGRVEGPLDKYAISFCAPPPPPKKKQNKTKKKHENSNWIRVWHRGNL